MANHPPQPDPLTKTISPGMRFVRTFLWTIAIGLVFAYGFQVTQVNLEEPREPERRAQLINVLRSLARPDLLAYDEERLEIEALLYVPCPAEPFTLPEASQSTPAIKLSAQCAEPGSEITVTGLGFAPGEEVFLYFVPYTADPSQAVELPLTNKKTIADSAGNFEAVVKLKKDRVSEEAQTVRAVTKRRSGLPQPSQTVYDTTEKIIETIFLALIATAFGAGLSVPLSFLAARNLMIEVTNSLSRLVTLLVAVPVGLVGGGWLFVVVGGWGADLISGGQVSAGLLLAGLSALFLTVQAAAVRPGPSNWPVMARRLGLWLLGLIGAALALGLAAGLAKQVGQAIMAAGDWLDFVGNFIFILGDALLILLPFIGAFAGAMALAALAGPAADHLLRRTGHTPISKIYTAVMGFLGGGIVVGAIAGFLYWLYELANPWYTIGGPALIGGLFLAGATLVWGPDRAVPIGMITYYLSRTILNGLRAIEPLIMVIVFVVWVGIGPFAGVLALTLHTIASLGKLYSEQVEDISEGPIEAVTATGANRLQTIVYAVVPQIVPSYIAFTIYRWDINVRMSTIIGFAGGGGIGFLLQQNLNLLKYRQASVQMLAIAIVVATLDYVSAKIRERIV